MAISDKFKKLALANGRHVSCKIELGNTVYYDDRLLSFNFHDVTHPDWFTIGTACPNEFSFTVRHTFEPNVHDEVRPYISFDGTEWCPLGIFYIARRYFRGEYATFVCYDKMYDLDVSMEHEFPAFTVTPARKVLEAVCEEAGLVFDGNCVDYMVYGVEKPVTLRQVIGYIAALNCACAKIDRYGKLVFKSYSKMPTARLSANNCFSISSNITRAGISGLRVNTGRTTLQYKEENSGLSMIELYNPLMRQDIVNTLGKQLDPLYFYGAEIEMQGLPFLEAGEFIMLEETDGTITPIVMSDIRYHYDGALTAKLYSRNKGNSDPVVHRQEFEDALAALWDYVRSK